MRRDCHQTRDDARFPLPLMWWSRCVFRLVGARKSAGTGQLTPRAGCHSGLYFRAKKMSDHDGLRHRQSCKMRSGLCSFERRCLLVFLRPPMAKLLPSFAVNLRASEDNYSVTIQLDRFPLWQTTFTGTRAEITTSSLGLTLTKTEALFLPNIQIECVLPVGYPPSPPSPFPQWNFTSSTHLILPELQIKYKKTTTTTTKHNLELGSDPCLN